MYMFSISKRPTIAEIHQLYRTQTATPTAVTQFFLNRSKQVDTSIKAILRWTDSTAFTQAAVCDEILKNTANSDFDTLIQSQPLFGIPYNLKDNVLVENHIATSSSKIMEQFIAPYSATIYNRIRHAGAILISQSNLDEWAVGSSTENSAFGPSKNPFDTSRVPGGSSGGPAAAVASGQAVFSIGSDTGGSIRVPAAFCDVVGVKPTYGYVPRYGIMPLASSLDQAGPFTNSVTDNAIVLSVIGGQDSNDQTTIASNTQDIRTGQIQTAPLKIGIPREYFGDGMNPIILNEVRIMIQKLSAAGHTIVEISLPHTQYGLAVYYTMMTVETAANLQRFDGVRYGSQWKKTQDEDGQLSAEVFEMHTSVRKKYFGEEPKRRIMLGTFTSSATKRDIYDTAAKVKEKMRRDFDTAFAEVDLIVAPTTPEFPFQFGEKTNDPVQMYLSDALVYGANLCKIPAISIPLGLFLPGTEEDKKLPTGIQVMAPEHAEKLMYQLALQIESLTQK